MQQELTLKGKTILLAATGGIAVYKSCELVRLLMKRGADVRVVMTENAAKFVTPLTFEALSGHPVVTSEWDTRSGVMPHIRLSDGADLIIVAPATANTIAKAACGIADNAVSTLICARRAPIAFAPAMNTRMWENPANTRNIETLKQDGIEVWGPAAGSLACGDTGTGRMLEPEEIASRTELFLHRKPLAGRRILITAGPTYEAIDPVRGITNRSSGRQGYAIAREAALRGAAVTLISGPVSLPVPFGVTRISVDSASAMRDEVLKRTSGADAFISVAAVSDWRPEHVSDQKIKKDGKAVTLSLTENPDILSEVGHLSAGRPAVVIGFAAETENIISYASKKLRAKAADLIIANDASHALGSEDNDAVFVTESGAEPLGPGPKSRVAEAILDRLASLLA